MKKETSEYSSTKACQIERCTSHVLLLLHFNCARSQWRLWTDAWESLSSSIQKCFSPSCPRADPSTRIWCIWTTIQDLCVLRVFAEGWIFYSTAVIILLLTFFYSSTLFVWQKAESPSQHQPHSCSSSQMMHYIPRRCRKTRQFQNP